MSPDQLKASILQYAIQGKLVEQRPEEGTAEDLYQQIQEEKQKLIKEGKIKKEKPLAEITEEEIPFDIPDSWKWVRLEQCVTILGDGIHGTPNYTPNEEYHFINGNNLSDGTIVIKTDTKTVTFEEYEKYKKELNDHTVFVSINGTIGNVAFYNDEKIILGKSACYFNLVDKEWKEFIYWIVKTDYFIKYAITNATGSTIKNVSLATMKLFPVPLPPIEEQHRIVAKIEELMPYVDRYAKAYEKLEQFNAKFPEDMKKSILQYAIQGKLVEQRPEEGTAEELYQKIQEEKQKLIKEGKIKKEKPLAEITEDEVPFDIPESWKWVRVCSVGVTQTGNTPKKSHPEYFGNYIPFLGPGDIQNGNVNYDNQGLSEEGKEYGRVTSADSVLQVCIGGSIGKCALVDREVTFNQQINSIYPLISDSKYVYYVLDSYYFKDYMKENSGGTATPIINRGLWDAIVIPLPPLEEQKRIVAKIEELMPYCDSLVR